MHARMLAHAVRAVSGREWGSRRQYANARSQFHIARLVERVRSLFAGRVRLCRVVFAAGPRASFSSVLAAAVGITQLLCVISAAALGCLLLWDYVVNYVACLR